MNIDSSPPAFPVAETPGVSQGWPGMTLREYYIGQALPAVIRMCFADSRPPDVSREEWFAHIAIKVADATLAALTTAPEQ